MNRHYPHLWVVPFQSNRLADDDDVVGNAAADYVRNVAATYDDCDNVIFNS